MRFVLAVVIALLLAGCSQADEQTGVVVNLQSGSTTTITAVGGAVESAYDPATGKPMDGTIVISEGNAITNDPAQANGPDVASALFKDGSKASVLNLDPGDYTARVDAKNGRNCQRLSFHVDKGQRTQLTLFCQVQ